MQKLFTKSLFFIVIFKLCLLSQVSAQTITINPVDPGPYGQGSTISVPIHVDNSTGCIKPGNTYNLYLSDAAGSFAAQKLIGTFTNFYATFVNGIIPAGTPAGAGYQVRVSSTTPVVTSAPSAAFTINGSAGITAAVTSATTNPLFPEVFGSCNGVNNTSYSFIDQSTAGSAVTAAFFNEQSQTVESTVPIAPNGTFVAKSSNYTINVKAVNGGIVGTKSFILINNSVNNSFGATGSNSVCLSNGNGLTYNVDISSVNGIQNNFPGLIYNVKWGDGVTSAYTFCDIVASGGKISHIYLKSSCGNTANGQTNSFEVDLQPNNKYCGNVGTQVTSYAKVVSAPINNFAAPAAGCTNFNISFINNSYPGDDPNNTTSGCANAAANYTWIVDGNSVAVNVPINSPFVYKFTTPGTHSVTLHLQGGAGGLCAASDLTHTICIQNAPQLSFSLPVTKGCVPAAITPVNQSVIDSTCNKANKYIWTVTGPSPVAYANGTNATSAQPQFLFNKAGVYSVTLGITTASCGNSITPAQTIIIDSIATAKLSRDSIVCGQNITLKFDPTPGGTQSFLNGSAQSQANPYNWVVTGGAFSFTGGTTANSQYPQINFTDLATYTITVTNTNVCGLPATATQHITFQQAPAISAGADTLICSTSQAQLNGSVKGVYTTAQWSGGAGAFAPGRSSLRPVYTPSASEITAGSVSLTLTITTALIAPCNSISSTVNITIAPPDNVTSAPTDTVCSATPLNYPITASIPGSTFTWTVDPAKTTASASGYAPSGNGNTIADAITNSDPNNYAIVTYNITALSGAGCSSSAFPLTVAVAPKQPIAQFTQDVTSGCDFVTVQFTNTSVPANSSYTWDFGDGSPFSTSVNPSHVFAPRSDGKDTTYTITMFLTSKCGNAPPVKSTVDVRTKNVIAFISPEQITGCSPFTLAVNNFSPGNNISYDYYLYDAATLVQKITVTDKNQVRFNPISSKVTKQYTLYMIATGTCGTTGQSNIIPITISASNLIAQMFIQNGNSKGCTPLTVNFVNNSLGGDNYYYTIYDVNHVVVDRRQGGSAPLPYTFITPGTYYTTITASNSCSTVESDPPLRIDVYPIPAPQFAADVTSGCKNVKVTFTNQTPDDPNAQAKSLLYDWDFGDGSAHSFTNAPPPHNYNYKKSPFTVTLTATNLVTNCSNVTTKAAYINITAPPFTQFSTKPDTVTSIPNYRFTFTDETPGNPGAWNWSFGDGKTSTSQNPGHTYADTGFYKVTLTASSAQGCDSSISHLVRITGVPGQLFLPNAFEPTGSTAELKTFMAKGSGIAKWRLQIFNNYAQLVWETTKLDSRGAPVEGWDGTFKGGAAPQGVYVWQASATFINGTEWKGNTYNNSLPKRTGVIHLIR